MRRQLLSLLCFFLSLSHVHSTGDSTHYLTATDTVFLRIDDYGNKIFVHYMEKGQTIYSLAQFYGLKVSHLVNFNNHLEPEKGFAPGTPINIPIPDSAIVKTWEKGYHKAGFVPVNYVVRHGDTFYRIAKHFFQIPLDTLKQWNRLEKTMMFSGMKLHVGFLSLEGIPDSLQNANSSPLGAMMYAMQKEFEFKSAYDKPIFQNGAAYWQREKKGANDYYCLHRNAQVGSVVQISNPMHKKTIYAKVIAPIPDRAYGDDIVIVLSPSVAKLLGARDPKFYVEIKYFQ